MIRFWAPMGVSQCMRVSEIMSTDLDTQGEVSKGTNGTAKLKVTVECNGFIMGEHAKKWQSRTGDFVRAHIPISYTSFSDVPTNFKDDVWNALMSEFELDIPEDVARPLIDHTWAQKFRTFKTTLRSLLKKDPTLQPNGVDPLIWSNFLTNERNPEKIEQKKRNVVNRRKSTFSHTLGRQTYAQKQHIMEKSNSGELVTRKDLWLVAHERKHGTVLEVAKPKYDELKAVTKKRRQDSEGSSYSFSSINNDEVSEVFGKHRKGGIRAMGSHVTKNRVLQSGVGKAKHILCSDEEKAKQNEVIYEMSSQLTDLKALVMTILKKLPADFDSSSVSFEKATPTGEICSTFTHGHMSVSRKLDQVLATTEVARCCSNAQICVTLHDKFGKKS